MGCFFSSIELCMVDTIQTTVFVQSLSNFISKLLMMRFGSWGQMLWSILAQGRGCHALHCLVIINQVHV